LFWSTLLAPPHRQHRTAAFLALPAAQMIRGTLKNPFSFFKISFAHFHWRGRNVWEDESLMCSQLCSVGTNEDANSRMQAALTRGHVPVSSASAAILLISLLSHVRVATPARSFLSHSSPTHAHAASDSRQVDPGTSILHGGQGRPALAFGGCATEQGAGCRWHGRRGNGKGGILRLRGGASDNRQYYEVLKLPVGEEDEIVLHPIPFAVFFLHHQWVAFWFSFTPMYACKHHDKLYSCMHMSVQLFVCIFHDPHMVPGIQMIF